MKSIADLASKVRAISTRPSQEAREQEGQENAARRKRHAADVDEHRRRTTKPISTAGTIASIWKSASRSTVSWKRGAMSRMPATRNISRLYSTATLDVLDSPAYRARLANQTDWSRQTMAHFKNMLRVVARITISNGTGRGAALGVVRLRPSADNAAAWRDALQEKLTPGDLDGIISMHLLESEPELSGATADIPAVRNEGARDWFVLIDGTHVGAVSDRHRRALHRPGCVALPASGLRRHLRPDVGSREERHRAVS